MRIISESDLFDRIQKQVMSLHRQGRVVHSVEMSMLEFKQLDEDGHIRVNVNRGGQEHYTIYIDDLEQELTVRIV